MSTNIKLQFSLKALKTDQFAIISKNHQEGKEIGIAHQIAFGGNLQHRILSVSTAFNFEIDKNPFLVIEVSAHFEIEQKTWESFLQNDESLLVPKGFMAHLAMITVGSTRGVLHSKTENSVFNKYVLPTINVAAIIKEDVHISLAKPA